MHYLVCIFEDAKNLTCNLNLNLTLIFGQVAICIVTMITKPPLGGVYCSMILGVLQVSSTTRNLVPRFMRWSKGEAILAGSASGSYLKEGDFRSTRTYRECYTEIQQVLTR